MIAFQYFSKLQISKFGISFNYSNENRRAFSYLITPTLIAFVLIILNIIAVVPDWNVLMSFKFLQWAGPQFLRSIECITVSMSFTIFLRSLYIRFATLNSLLRYNLDLLALSPLIHE